MDDETQLNIVEAAGDDVALEIYRECELDARYRNPKSRLKDRLKKGLSRHCSCSGDACKRFFYSYFPILSWLPNYNIKEDLLGDVAAGLTVGVVQIPQGLAYALLATLPPIVGLYVSLFPVLLYPILGTCRHVSMGTFAILSILISGVLDQRVPSTYCEGGDSLGLSTLISATTSSLSYDNHTANATLSTVTEISVCEERYTQRKIEVAVALSVCVGIWQILMHIFRLGIITVFLSESMLSGFLCGASFLVITSQIPKLFGIGLVVKRYNGSFALVYTYIDIFRNIPNANWVTFALSASCTVFLLLGKEFNLRYKKKLPVPIPWELFIVIISTVASYFAKLDTEHQVATVGLIKDGISTTVPHGSDVATLFFDSIPLAIVAFAVEISLCQIFATKHSYQVDPNQELFALGMCNLFGAFFSCFPSATSLSRSVIYEEVGAKTQLGAYFSSAIVLTVLLWIGPLFQLLPQAALAVIIIVNIKSVALLWRNVKPLWKISRLDAVTWIFAWFSVVIFGVAMGLLTAVLFSIFTVLLRTRNVTGVSLGKVSSKGVYRDRRKYSTVSTHDDIFVYQFTGPLFFANKDRFIEQLLSHLGFDPIKESRRKKETEAKIQSEKDPKPKDSASEIPPNDEKRDMKSNGLDAIPENGLVTSEERSREEGDESMTCSAGTSSDNVDMDYSHVIFDMSRCSFLDSDGAKLIRSLYDSFEGLGISLMLASCTEEVKRSLAGAWKDRETAIYVSLEGAVRFAKNQQRTSSAEPSDVQAAGTGNFSVI